MLPGITGEEIVRAIRAADGALPIIVISARITAADKIMLLQEGADDYLTKPFDLDELSARIAGPRATAMASPPRTTRPPMGTGPTALGPPCCASAIGSSTATSAPSP